MKPMHHAMQDRFCKELEAHGWITTKEKKVKNVGKVDVYAEKQGKVLIVECGYCESNRFLFLKRGGYRFVWQPYLFFFDGRQSGPIL